MERWSAVVLFLSLPAFGQYSSYTNNTSLAINANGAVVFSPVSGTYTGSQTVTMTQTFGPNVSIFYTTDGSEPTEASIKYTSPITVASSQTVKAIGVVVGQAVQNGQATFANWKTNLASHSAQSAPYVGSYTSPSISYCPDGTDNTTSAGCQGVQGIPSAISVTAGNSLPTLAGASQTMQFDFTSEGLPTGSTFYGTQILWPYNVGTVGCDHCTEMNYDKYVWVGNGPSAAGRNNEMDMNIWDKTHAVLGGDGTWFGLSGQCSGTNGQWEYNGQDGAWHQYVPAITQDCPFPSGTLTAAITSTSQTTLSLSGSVDAGSILLIGSEEMMVTVSGSAPTVTRGWAGTTKATHSNSTAYTASVHVQFHATRIPGYTGACVVRGTSTPAECVYIDYLILNNTCYDFHSIYGEQTIMGRQYSSLTVPVATLSLTFPSRCNDKNQIDTTDGSTMTPVEVGENIDQDNMSCTYGAIGGSSATYVIM